ncbi:MAG TPA: DUF6644 family protein [Steroidobacteraceae bacterium]|jgi:hypothetical protein|nr:DUF6644 family protein [Steroidobacteraceae bacterium]
MSLYHTAQSIEASALGQTIRESTWLFPAIESTHLLALALLGGAVLIISLSVLGVGLKASAAEIYKGARRYMDAAVITLLISGVLLGVSEPVKLYDRQAFWVKMISMVIAIALTYFAFNPMVRRGSTGLRVRSVTLLTMAAWLMVAIAGRWIGFS